MSLLSLLAAAAHATPVTLALTAGPFDAGRPAPVVLDGASPGDAVVFVLSSVGPGPGGCPALLRGACLDVRSPRRVYTGVADAAGRVAFTATVPRDQPTTTWWLQAALARPAGPGTSQAVRIDVAGFDLDSDGDGAVDVIERDLGLDPADPDSDGDGVPDGDDAWPLAPSAPEPPVDDVLVSDPTSSLPDPEFDADTGRIVWQTFDGAEVWVADVDPATGALVPADGRGVRVTTGISPIRVGQNGPEWVTTPAGADVVYVADLGGAWHIHTATETASGWSTAPLAGFAAAEIVYGSEDALQPRTTSTWFVGDQGYVLARTVSGSQSRVLPWFLYDARWVRGANAVVGTGLGPFGYDQVGWYDPITDVLDLVTTDPTYKRDSYAWSAPDLGGEIVILTDRSPYPDEYTELVILRRRAASGGWTEMKTVRPPPGHPYVVSPEPFTWDGRSYVSFLASTQPWNRDNGTAEVWIAAVDPSDPLLRRVSDDTVGVRKDPEPYTGGVRPWVYYTEVRPNGDRRIHRCELDL